MSLIHPAIWVSDLEETKSFYTDIIDLEYSRDHVDGSGITNYYLIGKNGVEIQFKETEGGESVSPDGIDHIGFSVEDIEDSMSRVDESSILIEPTTLEEKSIIYGFVEDPDGYEVELIEEI